MQTVASYKVFTETVSGARAKQLKQAAASFRNRLQTQPRDLNSLYMLGMIECQFGHLAAAQQWLEKALAVQPDAVDVRCHYGLVLLEQQKFDQAIAVLRQVIALAPGHVEATYRLGYALAQSGHEHEAVGFYQRILTLKPDHAEALNALGNIMHNQDFYAEALAYYRRAVAIRPDYAMACNNMGLTLVALGKWDEAEICYRRALDLKPDYAEAFNNLGILCMLQDRYDDAIAHYRQALALQPDHPEAHGNLGNALKDSGRLDEAITHYRKALRLKDIPEFRHNLSLALLATGQFEEGWRAYEARWQTKQLALARQSFAQPQWRGEEAVGRTILIHAEQGFGDTLQFCRYAPLLQKRGMRVVMQAPPELVSLLRSLRGADEIVAQGQAVHDFDLHCPMLSLPYVLGTRLDTIPASIPYLSADEQAVLKWKERLPDARGALRVGLVWAGGLRTQSQDMIATNRRRSMTPELLLTLKEAPRAQFYNLQKGATVFPFDMIDYMPECENFADTAALVANLDLIISVDTAMAHLAGALGKTVWMLNRFNGCWRWFEKGDSSPWYPRLRLFRQQRFGDWVDVVARVRDALLYLTQTR